MLAKTYELVTELFANKKVRALVGALEVVSESKPRIFYLERHPGKYLRDSTKNIKEVYSSFYLQDELSLPK